MPRVIPSDTAENELSRVENLMILRRTFGEVLTNEVSAIRGKKHRQPAVDATRKGYTQGASKWTCPFAILCTQAVEQLLWYNHRNLPNFGIILLIWQREGERVTGGSERAGG